MSPGDSTVLIRALPAEQRLTTDEKRAIRNFASALARTAAEHRPFTCLITSDTELRRLNREFRRQDYATDVLSFQAPDGSVELGEMAISAERAGEQAKQFGHDRATELRILMLHGLLHLTGYDHESDRGEMAQAESKWRRHFRLPQTLIARAASTPPVIPELKVLIEHRFQVSL